MNSLDLILFDLDGTLCDSAPDVHDSVNLALQRMSLPEVSLDQTMRAIGPGPGVFSRIILGEENLHRFDEYREHFRPIYHDRCLTKTRLFDGIAELLEELRSRGIKTGMVTNKPLPGTKIILSGLGQFEGFDTVVCADMVENPKPAPDMIIKACEEASVGPQRAMMIGDTDNDILSANAAGVFSCLAGWGYSHEMDYLESLSDFRVAHPMHVLELLDQEKLVKKAPIKSVNQDN